MRHKSDRQAVFLVGLIDSYQKLYGVGDQQMAKALGVSERTWKRRKCDPHGLTLGEIAAICKRLQIPKEEMRERIL